LAGNVSACALALFVVEDAPCFEGNIWIELPSEQPANDFEDRACADLGSATFQTWCVVTMEAVASCSRAPGISLMNHVQLLGAVQTRLLVLYAASFSRGLVLLAGHSFLPYCLTMFCVCLAVVTAVCSGVHL
jgi:hypothetical protein